MKKLILLSVIFALVAGSVFAADVSVNVFGNADIVKGSSEQKLDYVKDDGTPVYTTKDHVKAGYDVGRVRASASGELEDGTIGGSLRFDASDQTNVKAYGWVWWKPSNLFRLQIGGNPDDEFGLDGVTRWGYYQLAGDVGIINAGNAWGGGYLDSLGTFGDAFFGGYGGRGLIITSNPVEALTINVGFPIGGSDPAYKKYQKFTAQVKFDIDGVGTAGITFKNSLYEQGLDNDNPYLWAYFGLTSIENLGIDIGIGYQFTDHYYVDSTIKNTTTGQKIGGSEVSYTNNTPLAAGVGVNFSSGAFGLKARVIGKFLGSAETSRTTYTTIGLTTESKTRDLKLADDWGMLIDVQPSFAVNDKLTAYVSTGIAFKTGNDYVKDYTLSGDPVIAVDKSSEVAWHIQPYIVITPSYWSGAFFAGVKLASPTSKYPTADKAGKVTNNRILEWGIPIGITFSF